MNCIFYIQSMEPQGGHTTELSPEEIENDRLDDLIFDEIHGTDDYTNAEVDTMKKDYPENNKSTTIVGHKNMNEFVQRWAPQISSITALRYLRDESLLAQDPNKLMCWHGALLFNDTIDNMHHQIDTRGIIDAVRRMILAFTTDHREGDIFNKEELIVMCHPLWHPWFIKQSEMNSYEHNRIYKSKSQMTPEEIHIDKVYWETMRQYEKELCEESLEISKQIIAEQSTA